MGLIFPRRCPICDGIINGNEKYICKKCRPALPVITQPMCKKCGKQIGRMEQEFCSDCLKRRHEFEQGIAPFIHVGALRNSVYRIKYENKREYIDFYVDEIVRKYSKVIKQWDVDCLVPVPLHHKKKKKRGFNQAEIIAKKLSKRLSIPLNKDLLTRVENTKAQKELNENQRRKNLESAFKIGKNIVKLKKVALIDDIYTTGSTIDACSRILKASGIEKVYSICLSIGIDL